MTTDDKAKELVDKFKDYADMNNLRERLMLLRSIRYANIDDYTINPISIRDSIMNEIFFTKANCYFRRKLLALDDIEKYNLIEKYEHYHVSFLKYKIQQL